MDKERAKALLGEGISAEKVASTLGVTPSAISQLLSDEVFASEVADLRYENLTAHTKRDRKYDSLEDKLLEKLERVSDFLVKPREVLQALQVINRAERRGQHEISDSINSTTVVSLLLPTQIVQHFTTNINNQVIKIGEQDLLTISSGQLLNDQKKLTAGADEKEKHDT